ncbi:inorganic pyrophosphatase [Lentzea sp. BCCO 10_0061]|uniref:Inorganic pyrophosphatase n=1 Tax=Lentzea sokolovensis TaxID=3095429 RepID=A0ABU4UY98_9PSEU|nr:inorganic pyrophosphatase [Lentzea sp. BCCO 10_0061]MDX8143733.1 inorganic pyrophosphatase [Lentzea sp. BCCO 10_0061]
MEFFEALDELVRTSDVVVDRPRGTAHPRYQEVVYPLDHGYLRGTTGGDGNGVDVFAGTARGAGVVGVLLTADVGKRDAEVKILLDCAPDEAELAREFLAALGIGGHLVERVSG